MLPRCEKHNRVIYKGMDGCIECIKERETPEEREETRRRFLEIATEVMPFAGKLKKRMLELKKTSVRVKCPNKSHTEETFITASLYSRGSRPPHLHFSCSDPLCHYRMME